MSHILRGLREIAWGAHKQETRGSWREGLRNQRDWQRKKKSDREHTHQRRAARGGAAVWDMQARGAEGRDRKVVVGRSCMLLLELLWRGERSTGEEPLCW